MDGAANASSFWASKSATLKSSNTSTPTMSDTPKPQGSATWSKKSLTLLGMANGTSPHCPPKTADWADSEDDEDFIASFSAKKDHGMALLKNEMAQEKAVTEGLVAVVGTRDARIQQLEDVLAEKELHISGLESDVVKIRAEMEELKDAHHKQYLYVQVLVADVDKGDRRIKELETELDVKGARIHELEMASKSKSESQIIAAAELAAPAVDRAAPLEQKKVVPEGTPTATEHSEISPTISAKTTPKLSAQDTDKTVITKKGLVGPAINDSKFPTLWSPDNPKKAIPPVEKPRTLVMAIDTSKFGNRATSAVLKKNPEFVCAKAIAGPTYDQSTKHRAETDVVPSFQIDKDIRQMSYAERILYANGPKVTVYMGGVKLATLPKYVLMQCSGKAFKHFTENTHATSLIFPAGCMDANSAMAHLQWMVEMTYQCRVYSLTLNSDEKFDMYNLKVCQSARVMGLNNTYVGHFTKILCNRIRSNTSSVQFLSAVCELAYPENDPVWECLANNLVNQQGDESYKHTEDLETLLAKYPDLKEKMANIAMRIKKSRAAEKRKGGASRDGSKNRDHGKLFGKDWNPGFSQGG